MKKTIFLLIFILMLSGCKEHTYRCEVHYVDGGVDTFDIRSVCKPRVVFDRYQGYYVAGMGDLQAVCRLRVLKKY